MTDYSDGNWHGWDGGECPVHPETVVEYVWHDPDLNTAGKSKLKAGDTGDFEPYMAWGHVLKFRVVKKHTKPSTLWMDDNGDTWESYDSAKQYCAGEPRKFVEVIE